MFHIKRKVEYVIGQQNKALKSSKMAIYQMIPRWMPFSTPIYIDPIMDVFQKLRDLTRGASSEDFFK